MIDDNACAVARCSRPTADVICSLHTDELVRALSSVVSVSKPVKPGSALSLVSSAGLWAELEVTLTRQHKLASASPGRPSDDTPVMFHEAASDAKRGLARFVWYWAYVLWNENQHLNFTAKTVPAACAWMAGLPGLLATLPNAEEMWEDITREVNQARRVIDAPAARVYLGRCDARLETGSCDEHLYGIKGKPVVRCPLCGAEWRAAERQKRLVALVEDKTVSAVEVSRLLSAIGIQIAPSTVRTYAQAREVNGVAVEPRLLPVGRGTRNRPLYRVGDVLDIFLANQERAA